MNHLKWVTGFVKRVTERWKAAPPVHVTESGADFPIPRGLGTRGLYFKGQAFISALQMPSTVAATVTHEVIAHHGLRQLLRGRWRRFMDGLHAGMHQRPARRLARARDFVKRVYRNHRGRLELNPVQFADETAAAAVELCTNAWTGDFVVPRSRARVRFADVMRELRKPRSARLRFGYAHLIAVLKASAKKLREGCSRFSKKLRPRPGPRAPRYFRKTRPR